MSKMAAIVMMLAMAISSVAAWAESEKLRVNPIRKVVGMLSDMQKELEKEATDENELFEKAMCTCENGEGSLSKVIEQSQTDSEQLSASIESQTAETKQLTEELKAHRESQASAEADLERATQLRNKENEMYNKKSNMNKFSIDSLGKAIPQLERGVSGSAFMQADADAPALRRIVEVTHYLTPDKREKVLAFLDDGMGDSSSSAEPSAPVAEIVGVLKSMKDDMQKDLDESVASERTDASGFTSLKGAKQTEISASSEAIITKERRNGAVAVALVTDKNSLDDADTENANAKKYLSNLQEQCTRKRSERDARKKMRNDEIAAISEAITMLTDDDALDIFKKTLPAASLIAQKKVNFDAFMQTAKVGIPEGRFAHAQQVVETLAKKRPSARLNLLALTLSGAARQAQPAAGSTEEFAGGAAKVVDGMIDGMVHVLHDDDVEDEHKKEWCSNETEKTHQLNKDKQDLTDQLTAQLGELGDTLTTVNEDIKTLEEQINADDKQVFEATEQRKNEHTEFVNSFASLDTAKRLIDKAAIRLRKFYSPQTHHKEAEKVKADALKASGLALVTPQRAPTLAVQRMEASFDALIQKHSAKAKVAPIVIEDTPTTYKKKESGGVVGLMAEMKTELTSDMTAAELEEKFSAKDYARVMKDASESRAENVKALNHKKSVKADLEGKIVDAKNLRSVTVEELQNLALYIAQLQTECGFLLRNFENRHESRVGEEVGLGDAKTIVTGDEPPTHAEAEAGFKAESSDDEVEQHFEGGHTTGEGGGEFLKEK